MCDQVSPSLARGQLGRERTTWCWLAQKDVPHRRMEFGMVGCCAASCVFGAPRYAFGEQKSPAVPLFSARARVADVDGEVEALMQEPGLLLGRVWAGRSICSGLHGSWMAWRTPPAVWPCRPQEREASERPACRRLKMGRGMVSRLTRSALIASAAVASAIRPWQHGGRWQVPGSARACRTTFVLAGELYLRVRSPLPMTSKADTRNWNGFAFISPRAV
jgi:hypothetical protein